MVIFTINIWGSSANVQVHNLAEWSRLFLNKLGSPRGEPSATFRDRWRGIYLHAMSTGKCPRYTCWPSEMPNLSKSGASLIFRWSWGSVAVRLMDVTVTRGASLEVHQGCWDSWISWLSLAAWISYVSCEVPFFCCLHHQSSAFLLLNFHMFDVIPLFFRWHVPLASLQSPPIFAGGDQYCPSSGTSIWAVSVCQLLESQGLSAIIDVAWSENRGYPQIAHLCSFDII